MCQKKKSAWTQRKIKKAKKEDKRIAFELKTKKYLLRIKKMKIIPCYFFHIIVLYYKYKLCKKLKRKNTRKGQL